MLFTKSLIKTNPTAKGDSVNYDLILKAGLVHQVSAGLYDFLPAAKRVLNNIEGIIKQEMDSTGAVQISMPIMQPSKLWMQSGRWDIYGEEMFKLEDRKKSGYCLGPTHEELVVEFMRSIITSHKDLPVTVYQFGEKFRDERRPRGGIVRARQFTMKDAYSFGRDAQDLDEAYGNMRIAYQNVFSRVNINAIPTVANPGEMGGGGSEEFLAPSKDGEDRFIIFEDGRAFKEDMIEDAGRYEITKGIEVGHIFKLGTKYSVPLGLNFQDQTNSSVPVVMGCYGIGVSRLLAVIVDQNHDEQGIIWPGEVAPYPLAMVPINYADSKVSAAADDIYHRFQNAGIDVLFDDRDVSPGMKFKDAKLLGMPYCITIGPKGLAGGYVEIEERKTGAKQTVGTDDVLNYFGI
ncbi:MAG: His/Gly/Thr/Pro-type tRNA ligase C-terminal domain-containing protein [Candidatus Woesearchaeota archaeon]|nr:His/Gly/Thr/Pro-type tRNA ligase C-terminal domain-containing protein [Candidatus Woesearchaeota archaeon]